MRVKNLQENVVYGTITTLLESQYPDIVTNETLKNDIAAFVLNRLSPYYITGERGYTRFVGKMLYEPNQKDIIKIITLINHAIEIIHTRRKDPVVSDPTPNKDVDLDSHESSYLRFPVIIGSVRDKKTDAPIEGVSISLCNKEDKIVAMGSKHWKNPAVTQSNTLAYFSLWPNSVPNSQGRMYDGQLVDHQFRLKAEHGSYQDYNSEITVPAECCISSLHEFNCDNFHDAGILKLTKN